MGNEEQEEEDDEELEPEEGDDDVFIEGVNTDTDGDVPLGINQTSSKKEPNSGKNKS